MARLTPIAALATGLALAGCSLDDKLRPHWNPSITSVNQPVVQRADYVFDVAAPGGLGDDGRGRLDAWFASIGLGYGDRVSIDPGPGYEDPMVRRDVGRIAADYGLLVSDGAPVTAGAVPPGSVRVVVSRSSATVPGCPQWDPSTIGARNTTSPNYGCAVNTNLANMIANPDDLVIGQAGSASVDAATGSKAIRTYRSKAPSGAGALKEETTGGQ